MISGYKLDTNWRDEWGSGVVRLASTESSRLSLAASDLGITVLDIAWIMISEVFHGFPEAVHLGKSCSAQFHL